MKTSDIQTVSVIGAGLMGHGIALEIAAAGYRVNLYDINESALSKARENIHYGLQKLSEANLIDKSQIKSALSRIKISHDLAEQLKDADLVIEAAPEDLPTKQQLFKQFGKLCPDHTILASNTSGFMPSLYAEHSQRPSKVLVIHYANPPHFVPLVEIVKGNKTSDETLTVARNFMENLGKNVIVVNQEIEGFILNRLQMSLLRESLWLVENGIAQVEDIDKAIKFCAGRRWAFAGIFEVFELAGWDTIETVYREVVPTLASKSTVPKPLKSLIDKGLYGSKSGQGFYKSDKDWTNSAKERITKGLASFK